MVNPTPDAQHSPPQTGTVAQKWRPGSGQDPAARVPYSMMRHSLPAITAGKAIFIWPIGVEGFRHYGSASVAIHKYLGKNYVDAHVTHRDEAHIELSGVFAGLTSVNNMRDLKSILVAVGAKNLYLPGVFDHAQVVFMEDYNFEHTEDDRTHSISYTISFVRTVTGAKLVDKVQPSTPGASAFSLQQPSNVSNTSERIVSITDSRQTLRQAANAVYGDPSKWTLLLSLNADTIKAYNPQMENMNAFELSLARLNIGTQLRF